MKSPDTTINSPLVIAALRQGCFACTRSPRGMSGRARARTPSPDPGGGLRAWRSSRRSWAAASLAQDAHTVQMLPAARMTRNVKLVPHVARARNSRRKHVVAAVAYDGLSTFEFGIVVELFGLRRPEIDGWYEFVVCAESTRPVAAAGGVRFIAGAGLGALARADTIVIPGWRDVHERPPERLTDALCRAHARGARLVSICSGTFVLAATGLLDGRRAT